MATPMDNNYAPPKSHVEDRLPADAIDKASRGQRLVAKIIDGLVFGVPMAPAYMAGFGSMSTYISSHPGWRPNVMTVWPMIANTGTPFWLGFMIVLVLIVVQAIFVYRNAQTIGKKLMGIKIARKDGSRATFGRIFGLRYLLNTILTLIPVVGSLYGLIDVLCIFNSEKRCVHDFIADTIVVKA